MNRVRHLSPIELTPDARIDRAKRMLVEAIDELVEARLAKGTAASEWIDQKDSPLGRRRHLELVRTGVLRGVREGRRVLVRRAEIETYLDGHVATPRPVEDDDVDGMIRAITAGAKG